MKPMLLRLAVLFSAALLLSACGGKPAESSASEAMAPVTIEVSSYPFFNPLQEPARIDDMPPPIKPEAQLLAKMSQLSAQNADAKGWLVVPGTTINDAVLQGKNNSRYLRADNFGNYSFAGCYFMDYRNTLTDRTQLNQNSIIYGHNLGNPQNMKDDPNGDMFAQLLRYTDVQFARNYPYFQVNTPTDKMVFKIYAVFYTDTNFYYIQPDFKSSEEFMALVNDARLRSEHNFDVDVGPADRIMTLSTCTYKYGSGYVNDRQRFVVMGRLLRVNEMDTDPVTVEKNPSPKAPKF